MPRILTVILLVMLAGLQYRLWITDGGLAHAHRLNSEKQATEEANLAMRARNEALDAEIRDLKSGVAAIESRARRTLGMVKQNETFYLLVKG